MFGRTYALPPSDPGPRRVRKPLSAAAIVVLVGLVGLAIGALTLVGQAVLDPYWNRLANSGAI